MALPIFGFTNVLVAGNIVYPKTRIHIKMAEGTPIKVTGVTLKDSFKYELKTIEKGVSYDLVVSPKSTDGPDLGIIRIETDSKIAKQKVHQAFVVVRRPIPTKEVSQK